MPVEDLELLKPHLVATVLNPRGTLEAGQTPISHIFFPEEGLCSIVAKVARDRDIEIGLLGRDGMTGTAIVEGDSQSPYLTVVQIGGAAFRIEVGAFRAALQRSSTLNRLCTTYCRALSIQTSYTAWANRHCSTEARSARWLLMAHDRIGGERFNVTHQGLAAVLGVRRPGVTVALHMLEGRGLIQAGRGQVVLLDRSGLIDISDGVYGVPERV
jgi:CRP-like cAMP-binding protein